MSENHVSQAVNKSDAFKNAMRESLLKMFERDDLLKTVHSDDMRVAKAFRLGNIIHVFERMSGGEITAYQDQCYDFEGDKSLEAHLQYGLSSMREKSKDIYSWHNVFSTKSNLSDLAMDSNKMDMLEKMLKDMEEKDPARYDAIKESVGDIMGMFSKVSDMVKTTSSIESLMLLNEILAEHVGMERFSFEFYLSLAENTKEGAQQKVNDVVAKRSFMERVCREQGFNTENRFEYNDLDNHVWLDGESLVLSDQNCTFLFVGDNKNFTVYYLPTEYSGYEEEKEKLQALLEEGKLNHSIDFFDRVVLQVKEGMVEYCNAGSLTYCFDLDVEFSVKALEREGFGKAEYDVDVHTYAYQRDYHFSRHGVGEVNFILRTFLLLGAGQEYNKEKGSISYSFPYIEGMKLEQNARDVSPENVKAYYQASSVEHILKPITYLNEEWLDAFNFMVDFIEKHKIYSEFGDNEQTKEAEYEKLIAYLKKKQKLLNKAAKK